MTAYDVRQHFNDTTVFITYYEASNFGRSLDSTGDQLSALSKRCSAILLIERVCCGHIELVDGNVVTPLFSTRKVLINKLRNSMRNRKGIIILKMNLSV